MAITVNFSTSAGKVETRIFQPAQGVSVWGNVRGLILPAQFQKVRLDIPEISFFAETSTNVWGDYSFWFKTPTGPRDLTLRVTTYFPTGSETVEVPIGIEKQPPALPVSSEESGIFTKPLTVFATIAGLGLAAYFIIPRLFRNPK